MPRFVLVKHCSQEDLPHSDPPLSKVGKEEAKRLAYDLESEGFVFKSILSSKTARALSTAAEIPDRLSTSLLIRPVWWLTVWCNRTSDGRFFGKAFQFAALQANVLSGLECVARELAHADTILVVTHEPVLAAILAKLENITAEEEIEEWLYQNHPQLSEPIVLKGEWFRGQFTFTRIS